MQDRASLGPIPPHTEAKHDILRYHMGAWFPILGRSFSGPLQYIDGFAGPGEYEGGELGSPIIALRLVQSHGYSEKFNEDHRQFKFLFVEEADGFFISLRQRVSEVTWPNNFEIIIEHAEFESVMTQLLDDVDAGRGRMPPTLLLIDPFGSAGFTMNILARLSRHSRIDILINFNWLDLNRWILPDATKHSTLDGLYGGRRWRQALQLMGEERKEYLIREYGLALLDAGWHSTNFEMINNQNQTQYYLFFATRSSKGMEVIKNAMRRVSPDGLFRYADRTDPSQLRFMGIGMEQEYARELAGHLDSAYSGRTVQKEELIEGEVAWHLRWVEKDLNAALRSLESSTPPQITEVRRPDGRPRRRNSFPPGCLITFAP